MNSIDAILFKFEKYYVPTGRILMGTFFLLAGFGKLTNIEGTSGYIMSVGLPVPTLLAWGAAVFLLIAGASLITGYKAKYGAIFLALYTMLATFLFHSPGTWAADTSGMQQLMFMKNVAIFGGLLAMTNLLRK